jgi:hypothetical protein
MFKSRMLFCYTQRFLFAIIPFSLTFPARFSPAFFLCSQAVTVFFVITPFSVSFSHFSIAYPVQVYNQHLALFSSSILSSPSVAISESWTASSYLVCMRNKGGLKYSISQKGKAKGRAYARKSKPRASSRDGEKVERMVQCTAKPLVRS